MTECTNNMSFSFLPKKPVVADFDGGEISSHGGVLLLAKVDRELHLTERLAACVRDHRDPRKVEHPMGEMLAQRVLQVALGYAHADASDHLRNDPALKIAVGRAPQSEGALSSQPTMSRLDNLVDRKALYRMGDVLLQTFIDRHPARKVRAIVLDIDSSEDPTHGQQEFAYFNAFYDSHCYLPLFVHASVDWGKEQEAIAAVLRPCNKGKKYGAGAVMRQIIRRLKAAYPGVRLHLRADSGFAFPEFYELLEAEGVSYHIAVGKNARLLALIQPQMDALRQRHERGAKLTEYREVLYQADSWNKIRRVVVKLEILEDGKENPRFVVVHGKIARPSAHYRFYCKRGDSENRIKELKLDLRSDLTSCPRFLANQFRLLVATAAYVLYRALRSKLGQTELAKAQVGTLRQALILVGARIVESVRRIRVYLPTSYPYQALFRQAAGEMTAQT